MHGTDHSHILKVVLIKMFIPVFIVHSFAGTPLKLSAKGAANHCEAQ